MQRNNPIELIKALRKAADVLTENPESYEWAVPSECNCGMVAQCLLNTTADDLYKTLSEYLSVSPTKRPKFYAKYFRDWTVESRNWNRNKNNANWCSVTNRSVKDIFQVLLGKGFLITDFAHLENLSNPEIKERAGLVSPPHCENDPDAYFGNIKNVIKYLRAWADILCEQQCELNKETQHAS